MSEILTCKKCNAELAPGIKFCSQCGTQVIQNKATKCPKCGSALKGGELFCSSCGTKIRNGADTPNGINKETYEKSDGASGISSVFTKPMPGSSSGVSRDNVIDENQIVALIASWTGANLSLCKQNDQDRFANCVGGILDILRTGRFGDIGEGFEFSLFVNVWGYSANKNYHDMFHNMVQKFPKRFWPVFEDFSKLKDVAPKNASEFLSIISRWPYSTFRQPFDFAENDFKVTCVQTMNEGFHVEALSYIAKEIFLEEEKIRIDSDMYPESIKATIARHHSKLQRYVKKAEGDFKKLGGSKLDGDMKAVLGLIAPFSVLEIAEQMKRTSTLSNMPNPIPYEPLGDWENEQLMSFVKGEKLTPEMLSFFEVLYESATRNVQIMEQLGGITSEIPLYPLVRFTHRIVTTVLNMLSRRLRPKEHQDFQYFQPCAFSPTIEQDLLVKQGGQEMKDAFFPPINSFYVIKYLLESKNQR